MENDGHPDTGDVIGIDALRELVRALEQDLPSDDVELLDRRTDLAQREIDDGDPARAVTHLRLLVDSHTTLEGSDSESALDLRGLLGRALTEARLYSEAEPILRSVAELRSDRLGPDDPQTFVARGDLLRCIGRGGRPEEALLMGERLLADRSRVLGPEHPETLQTRGHIAQLHQLAGRGETAVALHEALLADRERLLGMGHPDVLTSWFNLVSTAAELGQVDIGQLQGYVVAMAQRLGDDHPATLTARGFLGQTLVEEGRLEEALEVFELLLAGRVRVLGELHPSVLVTHRALASTLASLGDAAPRGGGTHADGHSRSALHRHAGSSIGPPRCTRVSWKRRIFGTGTEQTHRRRTGGPRTVASTHARDLESQDMICSTRFRSTLVHPDEPGALEEQRW